MLIGYARVSKADGSQSLDLQRDALRASTPATSITTSRPVPATTVRDSTAACARAERATCSSSGSSPASAATSPTRSTPCRPCRPAAWVCGCSPGKARRSTPPPRHHRVRALPQTWDHPRDALPVRRAARPVAREGSRPSNRRAPARTGGRENVLRPAARWPSLGAPGLGRFLYCFLPNSPGRVVPRRRGSACNTLSAISALPAIRRGKAAFWSAHATAPGHQQRHRCCSSWPG